MQECKKMLLEGGGGGGGADLCGGPTYMYLLRIGGSGGILPHDIVVTCML